MVSAYADQGIDLHPPEAQNNLKYLLFSTTSCSFNTSAEEISGPLENYPFFKTPLMVVECPNQLKLLPILYPEILVEKNHGFLGYGGRKVDFFDSRSGV